MHAPVSRLRRWPQVLLALCLAASLQVTQTLACSTIAFPGGKSPLLAYNFDFAGTGAGYLVLNANGLPRRSILEGEPAQWNARYGSVTVNQIGPGMPTAGMNSAGLVVTLMWNETAVFEGRREAPVVSELEFIQYLLDTAGSVDAALAGLEGVRVQGLVPIHYFLFDRTGRAAVLTPTVEGLSVKTGADLPVAALTNTGYEAVFDHLSRYRGFGGNLPVPERPRSGDDNSLDRFAIAASATRFAMDGISHESAYGLLNRLAGQETRWQLVFEPKTLLIRLRIPGAAETYDLNLAGEDFACKGRPLAADLRQLPADLSLRALQPLDPGHLADSLAEVFGTMRQTALLGDREVAGGIAAGLIAGASCRPE